MYGFAVLVVVSDSWPADESPSLSSLACARLFVLLQKLVVRGFYTGTGYAPFVAASELAVKVC